MLKTEQNTPAIDGFDFEGVTEGDGYCFKNRQRGG